MQIRHDQIHGERNKRQNPHMLRGVKLTAHSGEKFERFRQNDKCSKHGVVRKNSL